MMKSTNLLFTNSVLCLSLLVLASCTNSSVATSEINTPFTTLTPSITSSPSITLTASITPAVIIKPVIHNLALNEGNIDKVENLVTFGALSEYCSNASILDTALVTRYINGQIEYLLASKDYENQNIQIWDLRAKEILQTIRDENSVSILFHPDQRNLISFFTNETAKLILWNIQNGQQQQLFLDTRHSYDDRYISISQDGLNIALFTDFKITEFNLQTNKTVDTEYDFPFYRNTTPPYVYSPTGNLIAVTHGYDEKLHLLDLTNQEDIILEFPFTTISDAVTAEAIISKISISSNEQYIAGSALNGTIYLWDFTDGTLLNSFEAHEIRYTDGWVGGVSNLAFSPESNLLLSVGYDGFTKLWDVGAGVLLKEINTCYHFGGFTQDGLYLVTVGKNGIEVWGIP